MKPGNGQNSLAVGFVGGMAVALAIWGITHISKVSGPEGILAEVQGEKLSREDIHKQLANEFVPVDNDEYRILKQGVEEWVHTRLLEKEAKAQGISVDDLYQKELWSQVRISSADVEEFYSQNQELFNAPFEQVQDVVTQELRRREYVRVKDEYLGALRKKYNAKIYLQKPENYVEGLALNYPLAVGVPSPAPEAAAPSPEAPTAAALPPTPVVTFNEADFKGRPTQGPSNAPITLLEFSDFHCPFCKRGGASVDQLMSAYPGKIRRVWRHFPLAMHPGADRTHEASECAHEQGKFWEYHDKLFETQGGPRDDNALTDLAKQTGLSEKKFKNCLTSGKHKGLVQQEVAKGSQVGVQGTPMFFLNGQEVAGAYPFEHFQQMVEGILNPGKAAVAAVPSVVPTPAPTPTAPPPSRFVTFNEADFKGRPSVGPSKASVTLVEFSDFHCPFCRKGSSTVDQLMNIYPGKIRRIWRHFPLPMHPGADRTHEASECANEQGKFWEYHGKLFETQGGARDDNALTDLAKQAGLNEKKFKDCLASGKYKGLIQQEVSKGSQVGVQGTPTFFVNGQEVAGAYPTEHFVSVIEGLLNPGKAVAAVPSVAAVPAVPPPSPAPTVVTAFNETDFKGRPMQGPSNAPITLLEFSDFHCPFCKRVTPTVDQLMKAYPGKIRRIWRHFPLAMHAGANRTHEASECANEQGKFWEYHDKLFETLGGARDDNALIELGKQAGLNEKKLRDCLTSNKYQGLVQQEVAKGSQVGVRGTPTFFVNGQLLPGAQPYESFSQAVQNQLSKGNS